MSSYKVIVFSLSTFMTHKRFSFVPYQTWQYCEVADIEPFQGQSDQISQFSIFIRTAPETRTYFSKWRELLVKGFCFSAQTEKGSAENLRRVSFFPTLALERREDEKRGIPPFFFLSNRVPRCQRWEERRRNAEKENAKNGNLWSRLSEGCPPSWSRLTTGVDQRNFAITLLPYPFLSTYLSISFSFSFALCPLLLLILSRQLSVFFLSSATRLALLCFRTP